MSRWIVSISCDGENPMIYGPYSRERATALSEQFNERVDESQYEFVYAGPQPLHAYGIRQMLAEFGQ